MTENSRDKVYVRADDVRFSFVLRSRADLSFSSLSLPEGSFCCIPLEISRDRAHLTLLSRTSPLRRTFQERIFRP